jgi:hypothetical protein
MPRNGQVAEDWSHRLGLAHSPLLQKERDPTHHHHALFDGVEGSFALSTAAVDREIALDWTWSSQLTTHIQIGSDEVIARQVATAAPLLRFNRSQVEQNLEAFFDVVVSKRIEPQVNIADHIVSCFRAHRQAAFAFGLDRSQWLRSFLEIIEEEISGDPTAAARLSVEITKNGYERSFAIAAVWGDVPISK